MKSKQFKNKTADSKMMRIQRLKSHWMIKKDGSQSLQIKRKPNNNKTAILMNKKVGLHQIIMLKKWLKLILLMLSKKTK